MSGHEIRFRWEHWLFWESLALFPASEMALQLVNYIVSLTVSPRLLPKLSFKEGIPNEYQTLVVVPMMLLTQDSVRQELGKLEVRYLANADSNLYFSLLSDFVDANGTAHA